MEIQSAPSYTDQDVNVLRFRNQWRKVVAVLPMCGDYRIFFEAAKLERYNGEKVLVDICEMEWWSDIHEANAGLRAGLLDEESLRCDSTSRTNVSCWTAIGIESWQPAKNYKKWPRIAVVGLIWIKRLCYYLPRTPKEDNGVHIAMLALVHGLQTDRLRSTWRPWPLRYCQEHLQMELERLQQCHYHTRRIISSECAIGRKLLVKRPDLPVELLEMILRYFIDAEVSSPVWNFADKDEVDDTSVMPPNIFRVGVLFSYIKCILQKSPRYANISKCGTSSKILTRESYQQLYYFQNINISLRYYPEIDFPLFTQLGKMKRFTDLPRPTIEIFVDSPGDFRLLYYWDYDEAYHAKLLEPFADPGSVYIRIPDEEIEDDEHLCKRALIWLLENGAGKQVARILDECEKRTPAAYQKLFYYACVFNSLKAAEVLWHENKIGLEYVIDGFTALLRASLNGHIKIVRFLLSLNANAYSKDRNGRSARYLAEANGHHEIARLLPPDDPGQKQRLRLKRR